MEKIIKLSEEKSNKDFEMLLNEDLKNRSFREGDIAEGTITKVDDKFCYLDLNLKSEAMLSREEFTLTKELHLMKPNAKIKVLIEKLDDYNGNLIVSRDGARKIISWKKMKKSFEEGKDQKGWIVQKIKGGWVCDIDGVLAFLPNSQVSLRPESNIENLMKAEQTFQILKLDDRKKSLVISRRAVLERQMNKTKDQLLSKIKVGDVVEGTVRGIVDYGVFLDLNLNGTDTIPSLLHVTDLSWSRVNKPSDLVSMGAVLTVKVVKIDVETKKVSVSLKDLISEDPFISKIDQFKPGMNVEGVVTKCCPYGAFVRIADGLEGLVHNSELHYSRKGLLAKNILSNSQKIMVHILDIQKEARKISLSYRKVNESPWKKLLRDHPINSVVETVVESITDFGLFVNIKNTELTGLCHWKDLDYNEDIKNLKKWKKGDSVKCKLVECDAEKEKIRLSIRAALQSDPFDWFKDKKKGETCTFIVHESLKSGIMVSTGSKGMKILIKKNEISVDKSSQRTDVYSKGDKIDAIITSLSQKDRSVEISIKALEEKLNAEAVKKYKSKDSGASLPFSTILGPALKNKKK